ncbi:antibiotic biosynthesis monooxygenase family protein [Nonomuraea sp. NPDC050404]|uniref:antibiotic biosynthesis monooxygenase family protein n=1 Tax=Nonomuraea sp. NPDC050404 TaxID=3155783 RepID=UPI0034118C6A
MSCSFRVLLEIRIRPGRAPAFEETWLEIAQGIARHAANTGQCLLRSLEEPDTYVVISDWRDEPAFREFETSEAHQRNLALLRPYRTGGSMKTMRVVHTLSGPR